MELECILDKCPKDGEIVNHLRCCRCQYNPLGDEQPKFAWQLCNHPDAQHKPDWSYWEIIKSMPGVAHLIVTRR